MSDAVQGMKVTNQLLDDVRSVFFLETIADHRCVISKAAGRNYYHIYFLL